MKSRKRTAAQFQCSHCNKQFKYESDKKRHEMSHSSQFKCEVCSKKFNFISALRRHQKQHQRTGSVVCSDCGKKFKDEELLKRHVQYAHNGTHLCPKCKATFSSELALTIHMKTHNAKSERKYVCSSKGCGKSFNFPHHLKHHELTHTDVKQYNCNVCNKGFIQSHHLKTHMKTHDPEKWLYCSMKGCKKKFSTEYSRKRHLAMHKKQERQTITDTEYDQSFPKDFISESKVFDKILYETDNEEICNTRDVSPEPETKELTEIEFEPEMKEAVTEILDVTTCKTALGQCIMDGEANCLCAQISSHPDTKNTSEERFNNSPQETIRIQTNEDDSEDIQDPIDNMRACEGCECSSYKKVVELSNICPNADKAPAILPDIEYSIDGIVKLKDTFDVDIVERVRDETKNVVPYYSCKAVLGNCIVSGNGTMGEGCLCAKMYADEQAMEQEIDDITPRPKC